MILGCILEGVDDVAPYTLETVADHLDNITVTEPHLFIHSCIEEEGRVGLELAKYLVRVLIKQNGHENTCKHLAAVCAHYAFTSSSTKCQSRALMAVFAHALRNVDSQPGVIHPKLLPPYLEMLAYNNVIHARHLAMITPEMCEMWNSEKTLHHRRRNISCIHTFLATPDGWENVSKLPILKSIARMGFGKIAFGWRGESAPYSPEYIRMLCEENPDVQPDSDQTFSLSRREPTPDSWRCVGRFLFPSREAAQQSAELLWKACIAFGNGYIGKSSFRLVWLESQLVAYSSNQKLRFCRNSVIASVVQAIEVTI